MTDQTLAPAASTDPAASSVPTSSVPTSSVPTSSVPAATSPTAPTTAPAAPAAPSRGSLVSFTRDNGWGPQQVAGVVLGVDGSGEFAIVAPLPAASAVPVGDLH